MADVDLESLFVEQAEYLEDTQFSQWAIQHPHELEILRKLKASGAKLIVGPRGCGKTTLLKKAWHRMAGEAGALVLPIYVNFKSSLRLEPLYKSNANASFWFGQWLYLRTLGGLEEALSKVGTSISELRTEFAQYRLIADHLQIGDVELAKAKLTEPMTPAQFAAILQKALSACSRQRAVLLFDDAGHAFSPEQQRDFFDFFRTIKSPNLHFPRTEQDTIVTLNFASFHEAAAVCTALVSAFNIELFKVMVLRWRDDWPTRIPGWNGKIANKYFSRLWKLFHSDIDEAAGRVASVMSRAKCKAMALKP